MLNKGGSSELNSLIGRGSVFNGNFNIANSIRIEGEIKGDVIATGTVTIGGTGKVVGNITSAVTVVGGNIEGIINSTGKIILESSARVKGSIRTPKLQIHEGAWFEGESSMSGKAAVPPGPQNPNQKKE